jgi:propionate CoA-transferase
MALSLSTKAALLARILRWRLTWSRRDTSARLGPPDNPKFLSALQVAERIPDGATVCGSGLGGNARASMLYWGLRERFQETGHPRGLTCLAVGGIGGRGKVPGTLEELGLPGLTTRFCAGHLETYKSMLALADRGLLELQCLPQGVLAQLFDAQGEGRTTFTTRTGTGTFVDPRCGRGSPVLDPKAPQWVETVGDQLRYSAPKIDVALFNLPAADAEGNLYAGGAAMLAECRQIARAARRNGGLVFCTVGKLVEKRAGEIFLRAEGVDGIVLSPRTEQTASIPHSEAWPLFTPQSDLGLDEGVARLKFVNQVLGITPRRGPADDALARLAAKVFADHGHPGMNVNVGVGLPEEVCRLIHTGGLSRDLTFFTECGVVGGLPAPGIFFGAAVNPQRMVDSAQIFRDAAERLDVTVLGLLEADSQGNVNVSRRGEGARNQVGPGGFIDFSAAARTVVFVGSWMAHAKLRLDASGLHVERPGAPKFVERVSEVTFAGQEALRSGKRVFYCTNVGAFRLTRRGMELACVMPGIDVQRDVVGGCTMKVVLPESGVVPVLGREIVDGVGFGLSWGERAAGGEPAGSSGPPPERIVRAAPRASVW